MIMEVKRTVIISTSIAGLNLTKQLRR